jgi:hypothetical protein
MAILPMWDQLKTLIYVGTLTDLISPAERRYGRISFSSVQIS